MKEIELNLGAKIFLEEIHGCNRIYGEFRNADLVGVSNNNFIISIELKTALSHKVLEQAVDRLWFSNYVYVAIPRKEFHKNDFDRLTKPFQLFINYHGIGVIEVEPNCNWYRVIKPAKIHRPSKYQKQKILEELLNLKTTNEDAFGGQETKIMMTSYRKVVLEIQRYLNSNIGKFKTLSEILDNCYLIHSHYSKPRSSLYLLLNANYNKHWVIKNEENKTYTIKKGVFEEEWEKYHISKNKNFWFII